MSETETGGDVNGSDDVESKVATRRNLLGKGAAAAAVAAVAGVASSSRVSAANGNTMYIGTSMEATNTTQLSDGTTLKVINGESDADSDNVASIYGRTSLTDGVGVRGEATSSSGRGVYGRAIYSNGIGVWGQFVGEGTRDGHGMLGESDTGTGVIGRSTHSNGVGVQAEGVLGDVRLGKSGKLLMAAATGLTATSNGSVGTLARDSSGVLWYCYAADQWQRIGGGAVAGSFTAIAPTRVYDSRRAGYAPNNGLLNAGTSRVVSVKDGRDDAGAVVTANIVPAGATAVTFNVTVTGTTAPSHLSVVPGDEASTTSSTLNWIGAGETIANGSLSKLDGSRQLNLIPGPNGSFHCIIDITGYYL